MEVTLAPQDRKLDVIIRLAPDEADLLKEFFGKLTEMTVEQLLDSRKRGSAAYELTYKIYDKLYELKY